MSHSYRIFGLTMGTSFPCPSLAEAAGDAVPDILVTEGAVAAGLDTPLEVGRSYQTKPGRFLWQGLPDSGRFLVEDGKSITVERYPGSEDRGICFDLLHTVMAAALRQRGLLVLHANAAVTNGRAVVVCGRSGAGKSTTLAALLERDCQMLSDDVTALRFGPQGQIEVLPGSSEFRLLEQAAKGLNIEVGMLPEQRRKHAVPAGPRMATTSYPLDRIYVVRPTEDESLQVSEFTGKDKFAVLVDCLYGPMHFEEHPTRHPLFWAIIEQTRIFQISRPISRWSTDDMMRTILGD